MPTARLRTGEIVEVPAGLDVGGARQYLLEHGASYAAVGLPPPEAAGAPPGAAALNPWGELASAGSPLMADILAGARGYASERAPGMTPQASPDTLGGAIGRAAIPVGVSLALPGAGLAGIGLQGAAAAGLEALRTGATAGDVVEAGAFGGAGAGLGSMASRLVSGIGRLVSAAR